MARTPSTMLPLGTPAPDFSLPDPDGKVVALGDFADAPALCVAFVCNHCPYVVHVAEGLAQLAAEARAKGVPFVAISSNDVDNYPQDAPPLMKTQAAEWGWDFPYLFDESQAVAKAYRAACTPDFYLFDRDRKLVYRGQLDDARPGSEAPVTGADLRAAIEAVLAGEAPNADQKPSLGCNIKWKPGAAPDYFG